MDLALALICSTLTAVALELSACFSAEPDKPDATFTSSLEAVLKVPQACDTCLMISRKRTCNCCIPSISEPLSHFGTDWVRLPCAMVTTTFSALAGSPPICLRSDAATMPTVIPHNSTMATHTMPMVIRAFSNTESPWATAASMVLFTLEFKAFMALSICCSSGSPSPSSIRVAACTSPNSDCSITF